ncbi:Crp/Fnr family transcriptional regulator [Paraliobacillus salinarum]|uniref:Crp/Fnr family transcriptional regulator n=1 Tax=Paraliobacillus salinarum TaxID=1158996 RepID=UPI0015F37B06|nr:Crp/Fnr family transcriptional regulator [Paraliobacillus salinarum]
MVACNHQTDRLCLVHVPIFNHLTKEEMNYINKHLQSASYEKGSIIFMPEDQAQGLIVVNDGKVKLSKINQDGKEQILRILTHTDSVGELSLFKEYYYTSQAEAITDVKVCLIRRNDMQDIIQAYPEIARKLLEVVSERLEDTENHIEQLTLHNVEQRIIHALVQFAKEQAPNKETNLLITLPLSKGNLAGLIGITLETLSRNLALMESQGRIQLEGQRKIIIKDINQLKI